MIHELLIKLLETMILIYCYIIITIYLMKIYSFVGEVVRHKKDHDVLLRLATPAALLSVDIEATNFH